MPLDKITGSLTVAYPQELVDNMLKSYIESIRQYRKGEWNYFGNNVGQYIEIVIRIIEFKIQGTYTDLKQKLPNFNERILTNWENSSKSVDDSYRIIIPRILFSMYCIRNKRGMIHKNHIDPNKMDAALLLSNMKWVLSELFRLSSTLSFEETIEIIELITNKEQSLVWKVGSKLRVLDPKMSCAQQILYLLYLKSPQSEKSLLDNIEYSNSSRFKIILKDLHRKRLIEYDNDVCILSPKGESEIEDFLK